MEELEINPVPKKKKKDTINKGSDTKLSATQACVVLKLQSFYPPYIEKMYTKFDLKTVDEWKKEFQSKGMLNIFNTK